MLRNHLRIDFMANQNRPTTSSESPNRCRNSRRKRIDLQSSAVYNYSNVQCRNVTFLHAEHASHRSDWYVTILLFLEQILPIVDDSACSAVRRLSPASRFQVPLSHRLCRETSLPLLLEVNGNHKRSIKSGEPLKRSDSSTLNFSEQRHPLCCASKIVFEFCVNL